MQVFGELEAITDKLATECQRGSYSKKLANNGSPGAPPAALANNINNINNINGGAAHAPLATDTLQSQYLLAYTILTHIAMFTIRCCLTKKIYTRLQSRFHRNKRVRYNYSYVTTST